MSVLNQSGEEQVHLANSNLQLCEQVECPLCMEALEVDDLHFYPCTCGYQICRFCWNRIREGENGLCPACRKAYPENPADFTPLSQEQVAAIKTEKKAREQKRRNKTLESRRALANVRVVQNNLVFVVGLPVRLADPEILKRQEYFGKYGKIHKVVINQSTTYAGTQGPSASAYVTYVSCADALRAIQGVNNVTLDGRVLKGSLGTTKYCANFMKNQPCPKPDCMYLHDLGDPKASFTKEEMHAGLHQVYERKLHNQLLQAQRDKPEDKHYSSGNSSTNAEKGSSKDGNQSNFIPTTVTSSNINVVNSSKSNKKECVNGTSGSSSSSSNGVGSNGKEAWPSLGSSPPTDSPARKLSSPKPHTVKSQENGTSESSSPTQQLQAQTKTKDTYTEKPNRNNKDSSTNGQTRKSKSDKKQKPSNSINNDNDSEIDKPVYSAQHSLFESDSFNDIDELESDRHSLLENHDLDNSSHSLLEDDNTHSLLGDRQDILSGLEHFPTTSPLLNGFRDPYGTDRQMTHSQGQAKELLLRERSQSEMLLRQNELLARQHNVMVDQKHYMPAASIGLDSASELLGANYHTNQNMLPPFGMRVDNSMGGNMGSNMAGNMGGNMSNISNMGNMGNSMGNMGSMGSNMGSMGAMGFMMHNQQLLQQNQQQLQQSGLVNGFDSPQSANEVRYLAENMDKFFTDFHKAQQLRLLRGSDDRRTDRQHYPHNMLSAERLEMEHKQRMNNYRGNDGNGGRAAGDGDDDLDFDPFKETQKAFAELMETELMQNTVSSGDNMDRVRRSRLAPPGFSHMNSFGMAPRPHQQTHNHGYGSSSTAAYSDWTAMDPAIMSTSVKTGAHNGTINGTVNGSHNGAHAALGWARAWPQYVPHVPLPPGFAPTKPTPPECIDAK